MKMTLEDKAHAQKLQESLYDLYKQRHLCDCILTTEDGAKFPVHKVILCSHSEYFKNIVEGNVSTIEIRGVDSVNQSVLLEYLYTGRLAVTSENVSTVHAAAQQLGITAATQLCHQYMQLLSQKEHESAPILKGNRADADEGEETENKARHNKDHTVATSIDKDVKSSPLRRSTRNTIKRKRYIEDPFTGHEEEEPPSKHNDKLDLNENKNHLNDSICENSVSEDERMISELSSRPPPSKRVKSKHLKSNHNIRPNRHKSIVSNKQNTKDSDKKTNDGIIENTVGRKNESSSKMGVKSEPECEFPNEEHDTESSGKNEKMAGASEHYSRLQCDKCNRCFPSQTLLTMHTTYKHIKKEMTATYLHCSSLISLNLCKYISKTSMPDGKTAYSCTSCMQKFQMCSRLRQHVIRNHYNRFKCLLCKEYYLCRRFLNLHRQSNRHKCKNVKNKHVSQTPKSCHICSRQFLHRVNLHRHFKDSHNIKKDSSNGKVKEKKFTCTVCSKVYKYEKFYRKHVNEHIRKSSGERSDCGLCYKRFKNTLSLINHMVNVHKQKREDIETPDGRLVFRCEEAECREAFDGLAELRQHALTNHPMVMYTCKECDHFNTPLLIQLDGHMKRRHHESAPICELCGKNFKKPYHLKIHKFSKHNIYDETVKVFRCAVEGCDFTCLQKNNLKIHAVRHQEGKPFSCAVCNKKLKTEKNLQKHMNKVHLGIRPFICEICGQSYGEKSELKMHIVRHGDRKNFHCSVCSYSTCDKGNFQSHMFAKHRQTVHEKQKVYTCEKCDYASDRKTRYMEHMKSHENIRDFTCGECGKSFITSSTLRGHIKWTHNVKSYNCDFCGHVTCDQHHLREHIRTQHTHRNVKPYKCLYCDFHCATSGNCRKHVMNKHKGLKVGWTKVCDKYANQGFPINPVNKSQFSGCDGNMQTVDILSKSFQEAGMENMADNQALIESSHVIGDSQTNQQQQEMIEGSCSSNQLTAYMPFVDAVTESHTQYVYTQQIAPENILMLVNPLNNVM